MKRLLILLLLGWPTLGAAEWTLEPRTITPGGVALVRWQGAPPTVASVATNGEVVYLAAPADDGWVLVGVDLESTASLLPVQAVAVDPRGNSSFAWLPLSVTVQPVASAPEQLKLPAQMVTPQQPSLLKRIRTERQLLQKIYANRQPGPVWEGFSVPLTSVLVGTPFGRQRLLNGTTRSRHAGVDLRAPAGTPVLAAAAGRVALAQDLYYTGNTVILDHGDGFFTLYAHLRMLACRTDEQLQRGAPLGEVGSTGRSTGPHLHWSALLRGARVDPMAVLALFAGEKH